MKTKQNNKTTKQQDKQENVSVKEENSFYAPKISNIHKGAKSLSLTLENIEIVKSNLNKPFHSVEYNSYSSSVGILLSGELKKEIYDHLTKAFSKEEGLPMALKHFLSKKITVLENGSEIIYASVKWIEKNGKLVLSKPLPIDGLEPGEKFPYSFKGSVQLGFAYSLQHTFAIYLNGVLVEDVISYENNFTGLKTSGSFNPQIDAPQAEESDATKHRQEAEKENLKSENGKKSKLKFW